MPILLQRALLEMGIEWKECGAMLGFSRQYLHRFLAGELAMDAGMAAHIAADSRIAGWLSAMGRNAAGLAEWDEIPPVSGRSVLHAALAGCGVRQSAVARAIGAKRGGVGRAVNHDWCRYLRGPIRIWLAGPTAEARAVRRWMAARNIPTDYAFAPWEGETKPPPVRGKDAAGGFVPGDPDQLETPHRRAFMITFPTMRHFKMRRNPFANEIADVTDIFLSEDHYYIKEMMLEAAKHGGFCAVYGEVGSGKSTMRKLIYRELADADIHTIYPVILDKSRITAASLLEAIVMDLHDGGVRRTHEARTRQAIDLIRHRVENGQRQVIIIEEAHLLNVHALKALKQIWEWEMAGQWRRLVGIVLIGQPELEGKLDKSKYPQLREVIARIIPARIEGLNEVDTGRYLQHKFERAGIKPGAVISEDAPPAIYRRLSSQNGRGIVSNAHPLAINNVAAVAMNRAAEIGEPVVSGELVQSL